MVKTQTQVVPTQYRHWYTLATLTKSIFDAFSNSDGLVLIGGLDFTFYTLKLDTTKICKFDTHLVHLLGIIGNR